MTRSRAGIASAIHGRRPACQSRSTAASVSRRSAGGSAIVPNGDSTRQRRARKPSIWSVTPATPKTIAAGQLRPPSEVRRSPAKTGMRRSLKTVSAFGSCARGAGTARVAIPAKDRCRRSERPAAIGSTAAIGMASASPTTPKGSPGSLLSRYRRRCDGWCARQRRKCDDSPPMAAAETLRLPGFVNAHSHAFQRALRGRTEGGDFWGWRDEMLELAAGMTPELVRASYVHAYSEMLSAGYTVVGEFHYLGLPEAHAAVEAGAEAGIELVLLLAAYGRGGLERFRQASAAEYLSQLESVRETGVRVGLAPHSVRACPRDWLEELGAYAARESLPLHVHADEQPREIEECVAEHGLRPIELLAETGCLRPHATVVHATHADAHELDLLAESGARVCICPTTEANLGDGFAPAEEICERGIGICIGSGSNVRIDPLEELRELEGTARRHTGRRNVLSVSTLFCCGADEGAASVGLERWPDVEVDLEHPSLADVEPGDVHAALVFGCGADVFA